MIAMYSIHFFFVNEVRRWCVCVCVLHVHEIVPFVVLIDFIIIIDLVSVQIAYTAKRPGDSQIQPPQRTNQ